jgi:hypothetical protein
VVLVVAAVHLVLVVLALLGKVLLGVLEEIAAALIMGGEAEEVLLLSVETGLVALAGQVGLVQLLL